MKAKKPDTLKTTQERVSALIRHNSTQGLQIDALNKRQAAQDSSLRESLDSLRAKGDVAGRIAGLHSQQIDQLQSDVRFLKERKGDDLLHMKIDRVVESHGNKITELVERIQRLEGGKGAVFDEAARELETLNRVNKLEDDVRQLENLLRIPTGKTSEIKQLQPNQLAMVVFSAKRGNIHNVLLYPATDAGRRQIQVDERRLNTAGYVCDAPWLALDPSYVDAWLGDDEEFGS